MSCRFHPALLALLLAAQPALAAGNWTAKGFETPESVLLDREGGRLFVSNVVGAMDAKDGNGYIAVIGLDGKTVTPRFSAGMDGPKGMVLTGGRLYVSDIDKLHAIDPATGALLQTWPATGAGFLNDLATDGTRVFVSDMAMDRIYALEDDKLSVWLEDEALEHPNGLEVADGKLYVAAWGRGLREDATTEEPGRLLAVDLASKAIAPLGAGAPVGNLDGLRPDGAGGWFVTDFIAGGVFHYDAEGEARQILELPPGSADLEFLADERVVLIPMTMAGEVVARKID
jgi:DNA-binding beta-propeller fold protein YncE